VRNPWIRWVTGLLAIALYACRGPEPPTPAGKPTPPAVESTEPDDDATADAALAAEAGIQPAAPAPSNAVGCSPGSRCISVTGTGRPQPSGGSVAQCRGRFADFIVPKNTIPANYNGPWFTPNLLEQAHTGVPQSTRPWLAFDARVETQRLQYLLALRNYAFASHVVRALTPQLTDDADFFDPAGGAVPAAQRNQKWYPAPRMIYGSPSAPGAREAAHGMTLERTVRVNELGGNTSAFRNYAVAYSDARGARNYARIWSTATPGVDAPNRTRMRFTEGALVYKLLYSAARPQDFPQDILAGSLSASILPNAGGAPVNVRLLQIDIAVKDRRAGPTGWYFATYAYDRSIPGASPWLKMAPVGLMWGNDPDGVPITESWINPAAPEYARTHLGVDGRLNGPVDNPASACMSCHSTSQAPSFASMIPPAGGACAPLASNWFRNLSGGTAFGRFDPEGAVCETSLDGLTVTAADYSLQLAATVTRALAPQPSFNPCTWDDAALPPSASPSAAAEAAAPAEGAPAARVFEVSRDPTE
jgi:hypothetical protein